VVFNECVSHPRWVEPVLELGTSAERLPAGASVVYRQSGCDRLLLRNAEIRAFQPAGDVARARATRPCQSFRQRYYRIYGKICHDARSAAKSTQDLDARAQPGHRPIVREAADQPGETHIAEPLKRRAM